MSENFKLIPKFDGNSLVILIESNGNVRDIAHVLLPADHQLVDNVETATAICQVLRKRIRRSL